MDQYMDFNDCMRWKRREYSCLVSASNFPILLQLEKYILQRNPLFLIPKPSIYPMDLFEGDMVCGDNQFYLNQFNQNLNPICNLTIEEFQGFKHEGNWTCQLKIQSNWINSTTSVLVIDNTDESEIFPMYMSTFVKQMSASIKTLFSMFERLNI